MRKFGNSSNLLEFGSNLNLAKMKISRYLLKLTEFSMFCVEFY